MTVWKPSSTETQNRSESTDIFFNISEMIIWIEIIFLQKFKIIITLLHTNFEPNPTHGSRANIKMVVYDDGSFLENCEEFWPKFKLYYSSHPHTYTVKISWKIGTWFKRYGENMVIVWKRNAPNLYYLWLSSHMLRVLGWYVRVHTIFKNHEKKF